MSLKATLADTWAMTKQQLFITLLQYVYENVILQHSDPVTSYALCQKNSPYRARSLGLICDIPILKSSHLHSAAC